MIGITILYCAYSALFIIGPIYLFDTNYASSIAILFWIPSALLLMMNWSWMSKEKMWASFWTTNLHLGMASVLFEFNSLAMSVWTFSEHHHKLADFPRIFGKAPIEEFEFYFGAVPFCLLLYLNACRVAKAVNPADLRKATLSNKQLLTLLVIGSLSGYAVRYHLHIDYSKFTWMSMGIAFVPILFAMIKSIKDSRIFSMSAVLATTLIFWAALAFTEAHCVRRGHWEYNHLRTLYVFASGPFKGIAIEELVQYYLIGPAFVIAYFKIRFINDRSPAARDPRPAIPHSSPVTLQA
jgi:hypothetical protein